ncbi:MAG: hypothetical protein WDW38_010778 [Sanguina aurantia]
MRMRCPHIMFTRTARVVVAHGTQRNRPYKWHSPKTGDNVKETIKQAAGDAVQQLGSAMQAALDKVPSPKPTRKASGATPALPPSEGDDSLVSSSEDESPPPTRRVSGTATPPSSEQPPASLCTIHA